MLPSPPPSAPEINIDIEMQPPPPMQPSPPSPPPMQPPPPLPLPLEGIMHLALLDVCFFLTLAVGFGALMYLLFCVPVQIVTGNDMQLCYDFF